MKKPWLALLLTGFVGFVVIRYVMGALLFGLHDPYLDPLGESLHAGAFVPLAWLWLLACLGASLALFAKDWRHKGRRGPLGSRRRRRRRSRRKRERRAGSQTPERTAGVEPAAPDDSVTSPAPAVPAEQTPAPVSSENIANLTSQQFEHIIAASFRRKGFDVELMPKDAGAGIDMVLRERDNVLLVRCLHSSGRGVDIGIASALSDAIQARSASRGVLATTGHLTDAAGDFCRAHSIYGLDASRLPAFVDPQAMPPQHEIADDAATSGSELEAV